MHNFDLYCSGPCAHIGIVVLGVYTILAIDASIMVTIVPCRCWHRPQDNYILELIGGTEQEVTREDAHKIFESLGNR